MGHYKHDEPRHRVNLQAVSVATKLISWSVINLCGNPSKVKTEMPMPYMTYMKDEFYLRQEGQGAGTGILTIYLNRIKVLYYQYTIQFTVYVL